MPKKYLLYIHDDRFNKEPKKSQLVNNLLATHYDAPSRRELVIETAERVNRAQAPPVIKTKEDAVTAVKPLMKDTKWGGPLFRDKRSGKL